MTRMNSLFRTGFALAAGLLFAFAVTGQSPARMRHVVFLITDDRLNYDAHLNIPPFADSLRKTGLFMTTVLLGQGPHESHRFEGLEEALDQADAVVVFFRRLALSHAQMGRLQSFIRSGKSVIGIRSADHGFSVRGKPAAEGYEAWWGFVPDILGHEYKGHDSDELGTLVEIKPENAAHEILKGVPVRPWKSGGGVYRVSPLIDPRAVVLLTGRNPQVTEPVAWIRKNDYGGKVFYTTLGYPSDFGEKSFRLLLANALRWATE